jgi:UDP-N-acetyl-D-glucosamine dehydrogenase
VIEAASTKPFGFTPFYPGPGMGGHCIPIDPFYLSWKAKEYDFTTRFIQLAGEINVSIPYYVVSKTVDALNERKKSIKGAKILILGVAYKKNVDDARESPAWRSWIFSRKREPRCSTTTPIFLPFRLFENTGFD